MELIHNTNKNLSFWKFWIFQKNQFFSKVFCFWCFCKINCNFEYRVRIRCIELYMVTWFKTILRHFFENFPKNPRSVNNFRTEHLGDFVGIFGPLTLL